MNEDEVRSALAAHDFSSLFIEQLGWEWTSGSVYANVDGQTLEMKAVAQKRGVCVLACAIPRLALRHRRYLRRIERAAIQLAHEHILIHHSPDSMEQVWQWAAWSGNGAIFRHREHPFRSISPPEEFVKRLGLLEFTLAEEDRIDLVDVLARIATGLDRSADIQLFFRSPAYIEESDRLARELSSGGTAAFHRFVLFHRRLATWAAHRYLRTGIDRDDLEQIAMIGLMRAAQKFDPSRGFAFSTYAIPWIRQFCSRFVPPHVLKVFMRPDQFWRLRHLSRQAKKRRRKFGRDEARAFLRSRLRTDHKVGRHFKKLRRAQHVSSLDDRTDPAARAWRESTSKDPRPDERANATDELQVVLRAIDRLPTVEARIVRSRFALDGQEWTLAEIGDKVSLSRERIRQLETEAMLLLRKRTWPIVLGVPFRANKERKGESVESADTVTPAEGPAQ